MSTQIRFSKMHGLGNDFVVIDAISQSIDVAQLPVAALAHRHLGIGFDQLLVITRSKRADLACLIYNADGSEAKQCGNGMRCVARFVKDEGLLQQSTLSIETRSGVVRATIQEEGLITVDMGVPIVEPRMIPFDVDRIQVQYTIPLAQQKTSVTVSVLSMGNPHVIVQVDAVATAPVSTVGSELSTHRLFPQGTNVGFMEVVSPEHIRLRTFERGVGETFACGSNACAAVVAGIRSQLLHTPCRVELTFGSLWIAWNGENNTVSMTGPATKVFSGVVTLT